MKTPEQVAREELDAYQENLAYDEVQELKKDTLWLQGFMARAIEADRLQRPSTDALEQALTEWNAAKLLNSVDEEYDAAQEMGESIEEYLNDLEES